MFDVVVHAWSYYFLSPRRLLTVAPHKIITNLWLAYTVFDALMHCGIASKIAHVLFFDACVKSHAFLRTLSERFYWITCVSFIFVDACVNRMRLFAAKKSQRILSECTLSLTVGVCRPTLNFAAAYTTKWSLLWLLYYSESVMSFTW